MLRGIELMSRKRSKHYPTIATGFESDWGIDSAVGTTATTPNGSTTNESLGARNSTAER